MRLAFGIVSLFPGGGLQRDCIEIARLVQAKGHEVTIYTCRLRDAGLADEIPVLVLQNNAKTNHQRQHTFALDFRRRTADRYDLIVGFDKLLELDVLYCADPSIAYRLKNRPYLYFLSRYRTFRKLERNSFARNSSVNIIFLSENQVIEYQSAWRTDFHRMSVIPPTLASDRKHPELRTDKIRKRVRAELDLADDDWVWLSIGVQLRTKGIDRAVAALIEFPNARLLIAGLSDTNRASIKLAEHAQHLGVSSRITWLGHREDIHHLMAAADLLVHPARYDTTGTVILEGIVNGLPVITTAACGYARHVEAANAGSVLKEPFRFSLFVAALRRASDPSLRRAWSLSAAAYGDDPTLYQGRVRAADLIVEAGFSKASRANIARSNTEEPQACK